MGFTNCPMERQEPESQGKFYGTFKVFKSDGTYNQRPYMNCEGLCGGASVINALVHGLHH